MKIQEVYVIHDYVYSSRDLIPPNSFDGKDELVTLFILTEEPFIGDDSTDGYIFYNTYEEAKKEADSMVEG